MQYKYGSSDGVIYKDNEIINTNRTEKSHFDCKSDNSEYNKQQIDFSTPRGQSNSIEINYINSKDEYINQLKGRREIDSTNNILETDSNEKVNLEPLLINYESQKSDEITNIYNKDLTKKHPKMNEVVKLNTLINSSNPINNEVVLEYLKNNKYYQLIITHFEFAFVKRINQLIIKKNDIELLKKTNKEGATESYRKFVDYFNNEFVGYLNPTNLCNINDPLILDLFYHFQDVKNIQDLLELVNKISTDKKDDKLTKLNYKFRIVKEKIERFHLHKMTSEKGRSPSSYNTQTFYNGQNQINGIMNKMFEPNRDRNRKCINSGIYPANKIEKNDFEVGGVYKTNGDKNRYVFDYR